VDPNGFNPRSHERGIDGSTTSETSLTKYAEAASLQAAMSFAQTSAGVEDTSKKNLIKAIITKKIFRILFFYKTQKMMKKNLQNTKTSNQKKASKKKSTKFDHEKNQQNPYKNQKVSGKRRKPTTSFINQQGRKD
jgi:hypothetical protein